MKNLNLLVRFLIELSALAALAYWGYGASSGALRWLLAIGAPLAFAVVWGLFVSPRARVEVSRLGQFAIELALLGAAALALAAAGQPVIAAVFAGLVLVSGVLNYVWTR